MMLRLGGRLAGRLPRARHKAPVVAAMVAVSVTVTVTFAAAVVGAPLAFASAAGEAAAPSSPAAPAAPSASEPAAPSAPAKPAKPAKSGTGRRAPPRPAPAPPAAAGGKPGLRDTVEARLRAVEAPPSEAELKALGPGVDAALITVAKDAKGDILVRARAVSALAYFSTPAAREFLERTVDEKAGGLDGGERLLLRKAAVALGWQGGGLTARRVGLLLEHADPDVRIDAAFALGLTRVSVAADLLRKRVPAESDARVRRQLERQIRVIDEALRAAGGGADSTGRDRRDPGDARDTVPGRTALPPASGSLRTRGTP